MTVRAPQAPGQALESVKGDLEATSKAVGALTVAASDDAGPPRPLSNPSSWARLLPSARRPDKAGRGPYMNTTGGPITLSFEMDRTRLTTVMSTLQRDTQRSLSADLPTWR